MKFIELIRKMFKNELVQKKRTDSQYDKTDQYIDISPEDLKRLQNIDKYTMTSIERRYHLLNAVRYLCDYNVCGAIVECGVWRGGSIMLAAQTLVECKDTSRDLYLYDTFEGMSAPTEVDKDFGNRSAHERLESEVNEKNQSAVWAIASLSEVKDHMSKTEYPLGKIHFIVGQVEKTIPENVPEQIALLRLDTDWYESTLHELKNLYPLVVPGGIIIIDDYGYWKGARRAVDEFLASISDKILLHRIDNTGRAFVKPL